MCPVDGAGERMGGDRYRRMGQAGRERGGEDGVRFLRLTGLKYMQKATRAGGLLCSWGCRSRAGPLRGIFYSPFSCIRQTRSQTRLE